MTPLPGTQTSTHIRWKLPVVLAVFLLLIGWLVNTPPGLLGKADAVGYAVCHRIDIRSFFIGGQQLPLCVRCTGMFLGAVLGLGFQLTSGMKRGGTAPAKVWIIIWAFVLAFSMDGLNSYIHLFPGVRGLYEPQHWLRLITGTGMGLVVSIALFPAFNQTVWADWDPRPAIENMWSFARLLTLAAVLDGMIYLQNPLILYPMALISAAGVLILLSMVYTMVWLILFQRENRFTHPSQLFFPLIAGFGLAIFQIITLDVVRYLITGTWDGFHFG